MSKNTKMNNYIFGNPAKLNSILMDVFKDLSPNVLSENPFVEVMESFKATFDNYASIECAQLLLDPEDVDGEAFLTITSSELQILIDEQERFLKGIVFVKDKVDISLLSTYEKNSGLTYGNNDSEYSYSLILFTDISRILLELDNKRYLLTEDLNHIDDTHVEILSKAISMNQIGKPNLHSEYQVFEWVLMGLKHLLEFNNRLIAFTIFKWLEKKYDLWAVEIQGYAHANNLYAEYNIAHLITENENYPKSNVLFDKLNAHLPGIKPSIARKKI